MVRYQVMCEIYSNYEGLSPFIEPIDCDIKSIKSANKIMMKEIEGQDGWNIMPLKLKKKNLRSGGVLMACKFDPKSRSTSLITLYYDNMIEKDD